MEESVILGDKTRMVHLPESTTCVEELEKLRPLLAKPPLGEEPAFPHGAALAAIARSPLVRRDLPEAHACPIGSGKWKLWTFSRVHHDHTPVIALAVEARPRR